MWESLQHLCEWGQEANSMPTTVETEMLDRLEQILRVLALQVASDKSVTERARLLKLAGMDNHTIAEVLNTSDATIRTLTSNLRRTAAAAARGGARRGRARRR
jgi:DNA-binding NarL/FixJ family response regulator